MERIKGANGELMKYSMQPMDGEGHLTLYRYDQLAVGGADNAHLEFWQEIEELRKQLADAQGTIAALEETILKMGENAAVVAKDAMAAKEQVAALQARVKELGEITKVICGHCCEPMEIPSKAVLQSALTQRTAELEAAQRKVDLAEKKAWLAAHDVGFFSMWNGTDYSGPPKLALLCNDTFAWATADCEDVLDEQIDTIVELFKSEGEAGVIKWIAQQRNMKPMESVGKWLFGCDAIKKERDDLQAELERVRERVGQRGLEVVMIGKVGHYVSTAVKEELERVRGELVETKETKHEAAN